MKFIIFWTMRPEIRPWAHFSIFPCFSHGDASVEPPGFEKHAAAPKQGIGFAKMRIIKNMKIIKKLKNHIPRGSNSWKNIKIMIMEK